MKNKKVQMLIMFGVVALMASFAYADTDPVAANAYAIDNFWVFITGVLVIWMQAGFAMVEAGFNSAKNTVNILFKNLIDFCAGGLLFYTVGYSLMYPGDAYAGGFFGFNGFGIASTVSGDIGAGVLHPQVSWLFQVAFAATAATIVSGAIAGRMKFISYLIYSMFISAFVYPISGFWQWGGGWLSAMGFHDFAGSLVVHAVGGFAGLAGAITLGPRIGRFFNGKSKAIPGHNLSISTLGVFILWMGWYGFNPGSQLALVGADNTGAVMLIAVNTTLAAMAGGVFAMILAWFTFKKPDLTMALNGVLAGLVAITANCDVVSNNGAIVIGIIAGVLVFYGTILLEKLKIDDPVGAFPVHGINGIWGGIAAWIFGGQPMVAQIVGSLVIPLWAFVTCYILFSILKAIGILRVSEEEELVGLDIGEHGEEAYYEFQFFTTQ